MNKLTLQQIKQNWLRFLVNGAGLVLSIRTAWMISNAPLLTGWVVFTDEPALRNIVLFTGKCGLIFLVLSLACTPLARLFKANSALQVRKALGLWGFGFGCFHSLFFLQGKQLFVGVNPGPELAEAFQAMIGFVRYSSKIPYTEAGVYALCLLLLLAITSNRLAIRRLGKNWKRLHCLVYLAVPLVLYHYWWRTVTPVPTPPPPDSWQVILFAVIVGLLLVVRVPPVRRGLTARFAHSKRQSGRVIGEPPKTQPEFPPSIPVMPAQRPPTGISYPLRNPYRNGTRRQEEQAAERVVEEA